MDTNTFKSIAQLVFLVVITFFVIVSILAAYVFIRYGRTPGITVLTTLVFVGLFFLGTLSAYLRLLNLF